MADAAAPTFYSTPVLSSNIHFNNQCFVFDAGGETPNATVETVKQKTIRANARHRKQQQLRDAKTKKREKNDRHDDSLRMASSTGLANITRDDEPKWIHWHVSVSRLCFESINCIYGGMAMSSARSRDIANQC